MASSKQDRSDDLAPMERAVLNAKGCRRESSSYNCYLTASNLKTVSLIHKAFKSAAWATMGMGITLILQDGKGETPSG